MAKRIAQSTLNASTLDILNVIRQNASYEYQQNIPKITKASEIPVVGEIIYGTPAFANQFINSLVNRIALVQVNSSTFNNPYSRLKRGYLEFGETVEEIFVNIAKVVDYSAEKAPQREFQRTLPDVRTAFHVMNWRVVYPVTIQDDDLKRAFLSINGVQDLIAKIVDQVYTASEYDEYLLFKYMLIKAMTKGQIHPVATGASTDLTASAVQFRGISNVMTFMKSDFNEAGVKNSTPKSRQVIFMDSMFNARFDVEVLASAFNMEKADFMGSLYLIDDFTTFDNERFEEIRKNSDMIDEVTEAELALLKNVQAVALDERWFQVYDNNKKFTEKFVASGDYWNYFYHDWKTVSHSPFSNAVLFANTDAVITPPASFTVHIDSKSESENAVVLTIDSDVETAGLQPSSVNFVQTDALTTAGIAVQKYGALLIPASQVATDITLEATIDGITYTGATTVNASTTVDTSVVMNQKASARSIKVSK